MKLKLALLNILLIVSISFGQNSRLDCSDNSNLNDEINFLYDLFTDIINDEIVSINQESYYLLIFGDGERDFFFCSLIVPTVNNTIIYQYSPNKNVVIETYDVNLKRNTLLKHLEFMSEMPEDYLPNLYYVIISTSQDTPPMCEAIIESLNLLPIKESYLIDFDRLLDQMKEKY